MVEMKTKAINISEEYGIEPNRQNTKTRIKNIEYL